ncbi:MAG: hypothetical protein WDN00_11340 [Limisphaerales bacterium]
MRTALADAAPRKVLVVVDEALALAQPELSRQIEKLFCRLFRLAPTCLSAGEHCRR